MICVGLMMVFIILQSIRYHALIESQPLKHYVWYLYYIPSLLIPCLSLQAANQISGTRVTKPGKWMILALSVSLAMIILVLTNDIHQMVFRYDPVFWETGKEVYTHQWLFYVIWSWMGLLLLGCFSILIWKCVIYRSRQYIWLPIVFTVFHVIWLILDALNKGPTIHGHKLLEFPETFCFMIATIWVSCMQIGLVPTNNHYAELFQICSVGAVIEDLEGNVVYQSQSEPIAEKQNGLIRQTDIRGGLVRWQTDITLLNELNAQLHQIHNQLKEEVELAQLENEWKEKEIATSAKNMLYDAIANRVLRQSIQISELAETTQNLQLICFYGSYVKRMANLMILASMSEFISENELILSMQEVLRQMEELGVKTEIYMEHTWHEYLAEDLIQAYELFEYCMEAVLPTLQAIFISVTGNCCKLVLEGVEPNTFQVPEKVKTEYEDQTAYLRFYIGTGGGCE